MTTLTIRASWKERATYVKLKSESGGCEASRSIAASVYRTKVLLDKSIIDKSIIQTKVLLDKSIIRN